VYLVFSAWSSSVRMRVISILALSIDSCVSPSMNKNLN
jgi:hypothetical protein